MRATDKKFRIGWLTDPDWLAKHPSKLTEMKNKIGVNTLWLESGLVHTAGVRLSKEVWERSPFFDWENNPFLNYHRVVRHLPKDAFPVLPGILAGADDSSLLQVLELAHNEGVEVWGHMGLWSYGSMMYPQLAVRDIFGDPIPSEEDQYGACFCPSRKNLNDWLAECLKDQIIRYPLDGIQIDHARFIPPLSIPNLWVCVCDHCRNSGLVPKNEFDQLVNDLQKQSKGFHHLNAKDIMTRIEGANTLAEASDNLFGNNLTSTWFSLRARQIAAPLQVMADIAHQHSNPGFQFGIDVFPPSIALIGGHDYHLLSNLDYMTGGFGTIGWNNVGIETVKTFSRFLSLQFQDLSPKTLFMQLMRLAGYSDLLSMIDQMPQEDLPGYIEAIEIKNIAKNTVNSSTKIYPPISLPTLSNLGLEKILESVTLNELGGVMIAGLEKITSEQEQILIALL